VEGFLFKRIKGSTSASLRAENDMIEEAAGGGGALIEWEV
jgi:hypothetical protein